MGSNLNEDIPVSVNWYIRYTKQLEMFMKIHGSEKNFVFINISEN